MVLMRINSQDGKPYQNNTFQDPREALIVRLKRQVSILEQENTHLRKLMDLTEIQAASKAAISGSASSGVRVPATASSGVQLNGGSEVFEDRNMSDFELDEVEMGRSSSNSRPASLRSRDTLRRYGIDALIFSYVHLSYLILPLL